MSRLWLMFVACLLPIFPSAQTIGEKRDSVARQDAPMERRLSKQLRQVNRQVDELQSELRALYAQIPLLHAEGGAEEDYAYLTDEIRNVRVELDGVQQGWLDQATPREKESCYALWHQPWSTLEQLVMDFGSEDYVYLIPPEIGSLRLTVASNLPVPRACWDELLQLILAQHGVGVRQLNPFLRELYLVQGEPSAIALITADRSDLSLAPLTARICFVLSPPAAEATETCAFLGRFIDEEKTLIERHGRQIFIISTAQRIQELLKLFDFAAIDTESQEYQMIALSKTKANEMEGIIRLYFDREMTGEVSQLKVLAPGTPPNALFVAGPPEIVRQAKKLVEGIEGQIADPREMVVYTYTARHAEVDELAAVLSQVYGLMQENPSALGDTEAFAEKLQAETRSDRSQLAIDPTPVTTTSGTSRSQNPTARGNFVVSPQTGNLIMVVEQDFLPRLKSLLRKLDIPKRMVRIDVLLFEKRVTDESRFGLDLLRLGSSAGNHNHHLGFDYHARGAKGREAGIVQFCIDHAKSKFAPAFDLVYDFLMAREDIRINSAPSVTTTNNVEAKIELVEEISIDTGTFIDSDFKDNILKRSFTRTQYGITINITPSIHSSGSQWGGSPDYVTLDTSVLFDTPKPSDDGRPPVIRRRISNQVCIPDGQTVVLGGLRSKMTGDSESGLPFLSEIPYFGKIFGSTKASDRETEMFIFITPTIIDDPASEAVRLQREILCRRPGDLPEFLERVQYARDHEMRCAYKRTLNTLFGYQNEACWWERQYR